MFSSFPNFRQLGAMDCGPTSIKIIAKFYGRDFSITYLREKCFITKLGVTLLGISEAAETIGLRTTGVKINYDGLVENKPFPCIIHWRNNHFVVLYKIKGGRVYISDPALGLVSYSKEDFLECWSHGNETGFALFIEPSNDFYTFEEEGVIEPKISAVKFLGDYARNFTPFFVQIFIGLLVGSIIMFFTPFLTQALIDKGVNALDINFVNLIILSQIILYLGGAFVEIIRSWILLHIASRINISLISDFLKKLLGLKIAFFESHLLGDILRRIEDHKKLENLLLHHLLPTLFSVINIMVFGGILIAFEPKIFFIFFGGSMLSILAVAFFLPHRKKNEARYFEQYSKNYNRVIELINGVSEIRVSNSTKQKRWQWEENQAKMFKIYGKMLRISQMEGNITRALGQFTTIFISYTTAKMVIDGNISLGTMFAINMIVAQLKGPVDQIVEFIPLLQDSMLSLERILEVHKQESESNSMANITHIDGFNRDIILENVSFSYTGDPANLVLKNINLTIPGGKTTAFVGTSGSGKSTLIKLLLRFYEPSLGRILIEGENFNSIKHSYYRDKIGVVQQEGKIFSDTIANNIALGVKYDIKRVTECARLACISEFIEESLPLQYQTIIGDEGVPMSLGQKQRILLARAFYKAPDILFLDEATSALDSKNEKIVMDNLYNIFNGKTILAIAHRLSTVVNADQIVVLNKGEIAEVGTHKELVALKGIYYNLVKNQLEVGS